MIEHWALVPFQAGMDLTDELSSLELPEWNVLTSSQFSEARIGEGVRGWRKSDAEYLYLSNRGFAVLVIRVRTLTEARLRPHDVAGLLLERSHLHRETISGRHQLSDFARGALGSIRAAVRKTAYRPDLFDVVPYVLSFYIVVGGVGSRRERQSLLALLEPSLVDADDEPSNQRMWTTQSLAAEIRRISVGENLSLLQDYDTSERISSYMSWAGVVAVVDIPSAFSDTVRLYRELETRVQIAWSMAYFAQLWCETCLERESPSLREATELRYKISPIVRKATQLNDASVPSRMRLILEGLEKTSGLSRQISAAESVLSDLERYVQVKSGASRRKYSITVEVVLLLLATSQAVPLFVKTPIIEVDKAWAIAIVVILYAAVMVWVIARKD